MNAFEALVLGIVQGLTEFLPISSSTHLKLAKQLFHLNSDNGFDLFCHFGTTLALIWFFRGDLKVLLFREQKKTLPFLIALLPLIPAYFLFKPLRESAHLLPYLALCMMLSGILLLLAEHLRIKKIEAPKKIHFFLIGAFQALALIPGISRSASTLSSARFIGWERRESVRFSFMLAIPTILGGNLLEILHIAHSRQAFSLSIPHLVGFFSSLGVGLAVAGLWIGILEKRGWQPFAWYCLLLGFGVWIIT